MAVVLERRGRRAIVLLPGGEIRRVLAPTAQAGDEIAVPERAPRASLGLPAYAAATLALLLALIPAELPLAQAKVAAYVTVDMDPSVELGVSATGTVLDGRALDGAGQTVLFAARVDGKSLQAAVGDLLTAASADGYLTAGKPAAVIVAGYSASAARPVPSPVREQVRSAGRRATAFLEKSGLKGVVSALMVDHPSAQAAAKAHVSAGAYAVYTALRKAGADVRVQDLKGSRLGPALQAAAHQVAEARTTPAPQEGPPGGAPTRSGGSGTVGGTGSKGNSGGPMQHPSGGAPSPAGRGRHPGGGVELQVTSPSGVHEVQVGGGGQQSGYGQGSVGRGQGAGATGSGEQTGGGTPQGGPQNAQGHGRGRSAGPGQGTGGQAGGPAGTDHRTQGPPDHGSQSGPPAQPGVGLPGGNGQGGAAPGGNGGRSGRGGAHGGQGAGSSSPGGNGGAQGQPGHGGRTGPSSGAGGGSSGGWTGGEQGQGGGQHGQGGGGQHGQGDGGQHGQGDGGAARGGAGSGGGHAHGGR